MMESVKNLFLESRKHEARITRILNQLSAAGYDDPANVFNVFPELTGIPVSFSNGETWTLSKIDWKAWVKDDGSEKINEYFLHFRSADGKKCVWRSYFGGSKNRPQKSQRVIDLYQDEWNREWWQRKTPSVLLDAAERLCSNGLGQEDE